MGWLSIKSQILDREKLFFDFSFCEILHGRSFLLYPLLYHAWKLWTKDLDKRH